MTQLETAAAQDMTGQPRVRYRGRHLPMVAVVLAALIATALAYSGMVLFGLEVARMTPPEAYALAGFLEISLVAVALMARNAALEGRPYGVLLTLTWILSGTSGLFAALHQVAVPDANTPYMVAFRFVPPLVAALMWHLALVGERHLVTGHTLEERRREHRVHQYVAALEVWRDARVDNSGSAGGMRKVRSAHRRQRAARDNALRLLTVEDFERRMQVWVERLESAEKHGNRLDLIGASSVKRGVTRGVEEPLHVEPVRVTPLREIAAEDGLLLAPAQADAAPAGSADVAEPFEEAFQEALDAEPYVEEVEEEPAPAQVDVPTPPVRTTARTAAPAATKSATATKTAASRPASRPTAAKAPAGKAAPAASKAAAAARKTAPAASKPAPVVAAPATESAAPAATEDPEPVPVVEPIGTREPLPETGHTRRVELFDRLGSVATATDRRSAFFASHQPTKPTE